MGCAGSHARSGQRVASARTHLRSRSNLEPPGRCNKSKMFPRLLPPSGLIAASRFRFSVLPCLLPPPLGNRGHHGKLAIRVGHSTAIFSISPGPQFFREPRNFYFLVYDSSRQRIYLSSTDHSDVFDLQQKIFLTPLQLPGDPLPPRTCADWRSLRTPPRC